MLLKIQLQRLISWKLENVEEKCKKQSFLEFYVDYNGFCLKKIWPVDTEFDTFEREEKKTSHKPVPIHIASLAHSMCNNRIINT